MASSRIVAGVSVVVTSGDDIGRCYTVIAEHQLGFEEKGRAPTAQEQEQAAKHAPIMVPLSASWGRPSWHG